jgi:hypothetical protein
MTPTFFMQINLFGLCEWLVELANGFTDSQEYFAPSGLMV